MTRYRLGRDPDTGKPCMVMAPDGPWCCAGEVERKVSDLVDALYRMRFAYVDGDQECPHSYEEDAYRKAEAVLTGYGRPWSSWEKFRAMYGEGVSNAAGEQIPDEGTGRENCGQ